MNPLCTNSEFGKMSELEVKGGASVSSSNPKWFAEPHFFDMALKNTESAPNRHLQSSFFIKQRKPTKQRKILRRLKKAILRVQIITGQ